jgi:NADPH2:quinone reductase
MEPIHATTKNRPMQAVVCHAFGPVDNLQLLPWPVRALQPHEVRVRVHAAGVNFPDSLKVEGQHQIKPPLPWVPGSESAGVVIEVGSTVGTVRIGERVMGVSGEGGGGFAQQIVLPEDRVFHLPEGMSFEQAAATPVVYGTTLYALKQRAAMRPGENLLVLGAAGGVGLTAIEIGKAMGARVIAAASTPEKLAAARSRGADDLINYSEQDLTSAVMALTADRGADVCFDPVGGALFDKALSALGWGGRIVLVGFVGGIPQIPANRLLVKNRSALGSSLRHFRWNAYDKLTTSVETLFEWYAQGKLKPMITREFTLDESVEALKLLTGRQAMGRILVRP